MVENSFKTRTKVCVCCLTYIHGRETLAREPLLAHINADDIPALDDKDKNVDTQSTIVAFSKSYEKPLSHLKYLKQDSPYLRRAKVSDLVLE